MEEEDFPELLEQANFKRLSKQIWQYETNGHIINFIGHGNSPLDYRVRVSGFIDGDMNDL